MTRQEAARLYEKYGSVRLAAEVAGMSKSSFHRLLTSADKDVTRLEGKADQVIAESSQVRTLEELMSECGVDPNDWHVSKWVANKWESYAGRDEEGNPQTVDLYQIKAWLERLPEWHQVQIVLDKIPREQSAKRKPSTAPAVTLVIPDTQIGFRRQPDGKLKPMHDRAAISAAIQLAELVQPDVIVALGDMLDFAPFGKYTVGPDLRFTTMPALVETHALFAELRESCPRAQIVMLEGNHEARLQKSLTELASGEYLALRPVDELDKGPTMTVGRLLSLDKLDVEYIEGYGTPFFSGGVMFHHGNTVRTRGGKSVSAALANATCSQVFGHIHRLEYAERRILNPNTGKPERVFAFSPGALTKHDEVPHSGGSPVLDWQQGVGLIYTDEEGSHCHPIPIHNGRLYHEGMLVKGSDSVPDRISDLGIPF